MLWHDSIATASIWVPWRRLKGKAPTRFVWSDGNKVAKPDQPATWRDRAAAEHGARIWGSTAERAGIAVAIGGDLGGGERFGLVVLGGVVTLIRADDGTGQPVLSDTAIDVLAALESASELMPYWHDAAILFRYREDERERLLAAPIKPGIRLALEGEFYVTTGEPIDPALDVLQLISADKLLAVIGTPGTVENHPTVLDLECDYQTHTAVHEAELAPEPEPADEPFECDGLDVAASDSAPGRPKVGRQHPKSLVNFIMEAIDEVAPGRGVETYRLAFRRFNELVEHERRSAAGKELARIALRSDAEPGDAPEPEPADRIEHVAQAIFETHRRPGSPTWAEAGERTKNWVREQAHAAVGAMR
jgi:hypothetical protein